MTDAEPIPEIDSPRSRLPVVIALVVGVLAGAIGWPMARRVFEHRPGQASEDPYGDYSADVYFPRPDEKGVLHMQRGVTVRWHVDQGGWFTIRWVDHRESPEVLGIRAGLWTSDDARRGPWTFRLDGEAEGRKGFRATSFPNGGAGVLPAHSVVMFPHFDPRLRSLTESSTIVSRQLDLPARMPMPAKEVDPQAGADVRTPPR